jgi:DNA-binding GntR family transcriptional regulator
MEQIKVEKNSRLGKVANARVMTDQVYDIIKEAIISLKLKPGERLRESTLASELGTSTTPIRGALERLKQDGLVEVTPFKGACVAEINGHDVEEIFEVRLLLEIAAIRRCASNFSSEDARQGEGLIKAMKGAYKTGEIETYAKLSRDFHYLFIKKFGNRRMVNVLITFDEHLERVRRTTIATPEKIPLLIQDYENILMALRSRNPEKAEKALVAHIEGARDFFRERKDPTEAGL